MGQDGRTVLLWETDRDGHLVTGYAKPVAVTATPAPAMLLNYRSGTTTHEEFTQGVQDTHSAYARNAGVTPCCQTTTACCSPASATEAS